MTAKPHSASPEAPPARANGAHLQRWYRSPRTWSAILLRYVPFVIAANLVWEIAQLPLYTIWTSGSPGEIAFAVAHCTGGDLLIALSALCLALLVTRSGEFVDWHLTAVGALTAAIGLGYTLLSERMNVALGYWAYAESMPVVPVLDVGLAPLAQWVAVPLATFWFLSRVRARWRRSERGTGADRHAV